MGLDSLSETTQFVEEQWGREVTDVFLVRLDDRIGQLIRNPHLGPAYQGSSFRQLLIHPLVTLYYQVEPELISLVLVWANRQDPEELRFRLKQM